jgi:hypothetical protein
LDPYSFDEQAKEILTRRQRARRRRRRPPRPGRKPKNDCGHREGNDRADTRHVHHDDDRADDIRGQGEARRIKFARLPREDETCTPQERAILAAIQKRGTCTDAEVIDDLVKAKFPTRSTPEIIYRYCKHRTLLGSGWIVEV